MGNLVPANNDDPVLTQGQQRRALRILNDINKHVKLMRRFEARINNLYLFEDFTHVAGHHLPMSTVQYSDHPLVQMLLTRRDRFQALEKDIARYEEVIETFQPADKAGMKLAMEAVIAVQRLRIQQAKELEAMEGALQSMRKDMTVHLHTCQKFITDIMKVSQYERLLRMRAGERPEDLNNEEVEAQIEKIENG